MNALTPYWLKVWKSRPDLQREFPNVDKGDYRAANSIGTYLEWIDQYGSIEVSVEAADIPITQYQLEVWQCNTDLKEKFPEVECKNTKRYLEWWAQSFQSEKVIRDEYVLSHKVLVHNTIDIKTFSKGRGSKSVLVAVPLTASRAYLQPAMLKCLSELQITDSSHYYFRIDYGRYETNTMSGKRHGSFIAHRDCWNKFIASKFDYLLMVEQDVFPPMDTYIRLKTLIEKYGADVASIPYKYTGNEPVVFFGKYPAYKIVNSAELAAMKYPVKVSATGFGCTMFTKKVLREIPFRLNDNDGWCADGIFGVDCLEKGYKILVDNRVEALHMYSRGQYSAHNPDYEVLLEMDNIFPEKNYTIALMN